MNARIVSRRTGWLLMAVGLTCSQPVFAQQRPLFRDASKPMAARVNDLLRQLSDSEKVSLLGYRSQPVERLSIPAYNWWNEALHGVARAGEATMFPQAIGMAATFDNQRLQQAGGIISTEARAKYNLSAGAGRPQQYMGLTFWSPNINIFRDPRWGRGQETYGEDPYLTATMGVAFISGIQGNGSPERTNGSSSEGQTSNGSAKRGKFSGDTFCGYTLKATACAKHFAVHSGPESGRHTFDAIVDEKDLRETYLYAFKKLVDAHVESIMCAYNRVNGEPCCSGPTLLHRILREEWKFNGHVVTDCGALDDIFARHKVLDGPVATAAAAIKAGVNLDCSSVLQQDALKAVAQGLLTRADLDSALAPLLRTQMKLGFFDDKTRSPYRAYGADSIHNAAHIALARTMAQESMVLLKNEKSVLPLTAGKYHSLMITGPNAYSFDALSGNYHGVSPHMVSFVEGITSAAGPATRIEYDQGSDYKDTVHFGGTWAASNADLTIAVIGLTAVMEGEEGDAFLAPHGGDRVDLSLPAAHIAYIKALRKSLKDKPLVAVVTAGSAVDLSSIEPYVDAIVLAWYPGEQGGNALADVLFGKVAPSGHLPLTFYRSFNDLPSYTDYGMKGRTYRYYDGPVQYPFGYGLSYTNFQYAWKQKPRESYTIKDSIDVSVLVNNTGQMKGDAVVQVYVEYPSADRMPVKELKAFKRVSVDRAKDAPARMKIPVSDLQKWDLATGGWKLYPGTYKIVVGNHSRDEQLATSFTVK